MRALPEIPPLDDRSDDLAAACASVRGRSARTRSATAGAATPVPCARPSPAQPPCAEHLAWTRPVALGVVVVVLLVLVGAVLAGCAFSEPIQRLVAHMTRDAGDAASAHPDDPAAARLVTATAALGELVGPPEASVAEAEFEGDVAAVRDETTTRGRVAAAVGSATSAVGTVLAGVVGTIVTVLLGPVVVRRVGSGVSAGVSWVRAAAGRAGVPEALVDKVAEEAAARLLEKCPTTRGDGPARSVPGDASRPSSAA